MLAYRHVKIKINFLHVEFWLSCLTFYSGTALANINAFPIHLETFQLPEIERESKTSISDHNHKNHYIYTKSICELERPWLWGSLKSKPDKFGCESRLASKRPEIQDGLRFVTQFRSNFRLPCRKVVSRIGSSCRIPEQRIAAIHPTLIFSASKLRRIKKEAFK